MRQVTKRLIHTVFPSMEAEGLHRKAKHIIVVWKKKKKVEM